MSYDPIYERSAYRPNAEMPQGRAASGFQALAEYIQRLAERYNAHDLDQEDKRKASGLSEYSKLQDKIGTTPQQAPELLRGAQGNPALKGMDLSKLMPPPEVRLDPLQSLLSNPKTVDQVSDIPQAAQRSYGSALPQGIMDKAHAGSQDVGGAPLESLGGTTSYDMLPPPIEQLMKTSDAAKQSQRQQVEESIQQGGRKASIEALMRKRAEMQAAHEGAPTALGDKVTERNTLDPLDVQKAGNEEYEKQLRYESPELQGSRIWEKGETARTESQARLPAEEKIAKTRADISATEADRKNQQKARITVAQNITSLKADIDTMKPLYLKLQQTMQKNGMATVAIPGSEAYKAKVDYENYLNAALPRTVRNMDLLNRINIPEIKLTKEMFPNVDLSPEGITQMSNPQMALDRWKRLEERLYATAMAAMQDPDKILGDFISSGSATPSAPTTDPTLGAAQSIFNGR